MNFAAIVRRPGGCGLRISSSDIGFGKRNVDLAHFAAEGLCALFDHIFLEVVILEPHPGQDRAEPQAKQQRQKGNDDAERARDDDIRLAVRRGVEAVDLEQIGGDEGPHDETGDEGERQERPRKHVQRQDARPAGKHGHHDDRVGVDSDRLVEKIQHTQLYPPARPGLKPPMG